MRSLRTAELDAWRALLRVHATITRSVEQALAGAGGITFAQYDVLTALDKAPGKRLRMGALADEILILSRTGLTRFVDRLENAGYVTRESCADDRRGFDVRITDRGQTGLRDAWPVYERVLVEAFGALERGEARALADSLRRFVAR